MTKKPTQSTNVWSLDKVAMLIVAIAIAAYVGKYLYDATGSKAGPADYGIDSYVFISNEGNDQNPGTVDQPFRTIRKAVETAVNTKAEYVTIGILGGNYELTTTDATNYTASKPVIKPQGKTAISLMGIKAEYNPRGGYEYFPDLTTVSQPSAGLSYAFEVKDGGFGVSYIDFNMRNALDFDIGSNGELKIAKNVFRKQVVGQGNSGNMLQVESFLNGKSKVAENQFYFQSFSYSTTPNIAINVNNHSSQATDIMSNEFYYQFLDQPPSLQFEPAFFPYIGVQIWGNLVNVGKNIFTIDSQTYPGSKTPTEESKRNLGVMTMYGSNISIFENNFGKFYGTPEVTNLTANYPSQNSAIYDNKL